MKPIFIILFLVFSYTNGFSQRVFTHVFWTDIDDFDQVNEEMSKHDLSMLDLRSLPAEHKISDSGVMIWEKKYDRSGRMIEQIKGSDIDRKKIDFSARYKKVSDSVFESIVLFPPGSTIIPNDLFVDSVIKGKKERVNLYKPDKDKNIFIRSLYGISRENTTIYIKRFDIDNKLIDIYYSMGNEKVKAAWNDTVKNEFSTTITNHSIYEKVTLQTTSLYSKTNQLLEETHSEKNLDDDGYSFYKSYYLYDTTNHLTHRITVDANGNISGDEKYFYKGGSLIRYTSGWDLTDEHITEEKQYDSLGNMFFYRYHPQGSSFTNLWRYSIDERGLCIRRENYQNDKLLSVLLYTYK